MDSALNVSPRTAPFAKAHSAGYPSTGKAFRILREIGGGGGGSEILVVEIRIDETGAE